MNRHSEEIYTERLVTTSNTKDHNTVRMLLDSNNIDYNYKSQLKPECCAGTNFLPKCKTTFFVKPEDIIQSKDTCNDIINKIKKNELKRTTGISSLIDKITAKTRKIKQR